MRYTVKLKRLSSEEPLYFSILAGTAEDAVKEANNLYPGCLVISVELAE